MTQGPIDTLFRTSQECAEVSVGLERLGEYELYDMVDMVALKGTNVGVVIKVALSRSHAQTAALFPNRMTRAKRPTAPCICLEADPRAS